MPYTVRVKRHFVDTPDGDTIPVTVRYMYLTGCTPVLGVSEYKVVCTRGTRFTIYAVTPPLPEKWPTLKLAPDPQYDEPYDEKPCERFTAEQFIKWLSYRMPEFDAKVAYGVLMMMPPEKK